MSIFENPAISQWPGRECWSSLTPVLGRDTWYPQSASSRFRWQVRVMKCRSSVLGVFDCLFTLLLWFPFRLKRNLITSVTSFSDNNINCRLWSQDHCKFIDTYSFIIWVILYLMQLLTHSLRPKIKRILGKYACFYESNIIVVHSLWRIHIRDKWS